MSETVPRYHHASTYFARAVELDGYRFASGAEATRYRELCLQQQAGLIRNLEVHPVYELAPSVRLDGRKRPPLRYTPDFRYVDMEGGIASLVVEDVKSRSGHRTESYRIRRHLLMAIHGICVREVER